jgi:hypothetical protein
MPEHQKQYKFFVDGKQYETDQQSITAAEIKTKASVPAEYQLFLDEEGDTPDKPLSDGDSLDLAGKEKHFFAVPPATFGQR